MAKERILFVEDAPDILATLESYFTSQGYEVLTAMRGWAALDRCSKTLPNLAVLDVNLPDVEGYEIGKILRQSARTRHIPIIFMTARGKKQDRIRGFSEVHAEYYIVKPFDIEEVHTIIKNVLDRARQKNLAHPVTNLPTAELINDQYRTLLSSSGWALAQVHINGFETFTQAYGAVVGEDVLNFTALLLNEVVNEKTLLLNSAVNEKTLLNKVVNQLDSSEDFVGQMVVGPDFIVSSAPEYLRVICEKLCERFDVEVGLHYNFKDRRSGFITINDDHGNPRQAPLMSLSIGVITSDDGPFYDIRELSETVEDARQKALAEAREQGRKSHISYGRA